jgi:hypothetical protein
MLENVSTTTPFFCSSYLLFELPQFDQRLAGLHGISTKSYARQLKMEGTTFQFCTTFREADTSIEPNLFVTSIDFRRADRCWLLRDISISN